MQSPSFSYFAVVFSEREIGGDNMDMYVYPIQTSGREILIIFDDQCVTWLDATDLAVKARLYLYITKHPTAGIIDLLNYCISQDLACGLVFDGNDAPPQLS